MAVSRKTRPEKIRPGQIRPEQTVPEKIRPPTNGGFPKVRVVLVPYELRVISIRLSHKTQLVRNRHVTRTEITRKSYGNKTQLVGRNTCAPFD